MSKKLLHILNGEGTAQPFRNSDLDGKVVVWNEALVDGPCSYPFGTTEFWDLRRKYILNEWKHSAYDHMVLNEFKKIQPSPGTEIVLWFEFDLFCQINLLALLSYASEKFYYNPISIVSVAEVSGIKDFRGYGQLKSNEFQELLEMKVKVDENALQLADRIWKLYCSPRHKLLLDLVENESVVALPFLKRAFSQHLRRFPEPTSGLTYFERQILHLISNGINNENHLIRELIKANPDLGYGDFQYKTLLTRLSPILQLDEKIEINSAGQSVLDGNSSFLDINQDPVWYGGAKNLDFFEVDGSMVYS